jgi:hypothetical protein
MFGRVHVNNSGLVPAMSAPVIRPRRAASFEDLKPACQVLILHEDFPAYTRAVEVCRRVMERFAEEMDFDIKCWNFIELADPNCARHAAKTAGMADVVLLSMSTAQPAVELGRWLDLSFVSRFKDDGALALVLNYANQLEADQSKLVSRLEHLAERMRMDFMCLSLNDAAAIPEILPAAIVQRQLRQ